MRGCAPSASPATLLGDLWPAADVLREHRGDSYILAWAVGGADAVEVLRLTEQWWGLPALSYTETNSSAISMAGPRPSSTRLLAEVGRRCLHPRPPGAHDGNRAAGPCPRQGTEIAREVMDAKDYPAN
jgi:hypothetical protein